MNFIAVLLIIILLGAVMGVVTAPLAFADHVTATVRLPLGASAPGCGATSEGGCFVPSAVIIDVGGEVIWVNEDAAAHTVIGGSPSSGPDGVFDSNLFMPETSFSFTFEEAGTYPYFCMIHPWMIGGVVIVQEETGASSTGDIEETSTVRLPLEASVPGCEATLEGCFVPRVVIIDVGGEVSWVNEDVMPHTATSGSPSSGPDGVFDSVFIMPETSFSFTFEEAGTYPYFCMIHPWMSGGVVIVQEETGASSTGDAAGGGCLIATAVYGSETAPTVQQLREIRDQKVMPTPAGRAFMDAFHQAYYAVSPAVADMERSNPLLRDTVYVLIQPMLASLHLMEHADSEHKVLALGALVILLNAFLYMVGPAMGVVWTARRLTAGRSAGAARPG